MTSQQCAVKDTHVCEECNVPMKLRTQIVDAKRLIVLKLDVWNKPVDGAKMVRRKAVQNSSINSGSGRWGLEGLEPSQLSKRGGRAPPKLLLSDVTNCIRKIEIL